MFNNHEHNSKYVPHFKWFVLQNFPFIEADFDAITNYELYCKIVEYLNKVITANNEIGNQVESLSVAFTNLTNYVDNYFENLDIQSEINNKLDEMAESGELTEIISEYLNVFSIIGFNTVSDMGGATNAIEGSFFRTYGKLTYNDGKGAFYKVRTILNTDVIDGDELVALTNFSTLVAEKMPDYNINTINSNINTINSNIDTINGKITTIEGKLNPINFYSTSNLVVFGDSFTDPDNTNSVNGAWVNRVASATGMTAFNFAKGAASFMRVSNSIRMQVNRAVSEMTATEKLNTKIAIIYAPDTDIIEEINETDYLTEVDDLITIINTTFPRAKIIFAGFTWRVNKLYPSYNMKMDRLLHNIRRNSSKFPLVILENCRYWLLGQTQYYQNEYHPDVNGYYVIASYFLDAIYGGGEKDVMRTYQQNTSNLDDVISQNARCLITTRNGIATIDFYARFSVNKSNATDWLSYIPKEIIPSQDVVVPLLKYSPSEIIGAVDLNRGNSGRMDIHINSLSANTYMFMTPLTIPCEADFDYN